MRIVIPGKLNCSDYIMTYRNFINVVISYLLHYFVNDSNPLQSIKKLFNNRVSPFIKKKLIIKPWINCIMQKQIELEKESITYNKSNPGFLLLMKYIFSKSLKPNTIQASIQNIWIILTKICDFKNKLSNVILFFRVIERFHDPVDSASNYIRKFNSMKHPQFLRRAKSMVNMMVHIEEFFLIIFLFITEKIRIKSTKHKKIEKYSFSLFINKIKV